jgi:hypothetical protein
MALKFGRGGLGKQTTMEMEDGKSMVGCDNTDVVDSGDIPKKLLQSVNRYNNRRRG